jgi:prophage regulatory protein
MATTILRISVVIARTGLARSTIYAKVAAGDFPEPINLGARAVGWLEHEVEQWLADRVEQSRGSAGDLPGATNSFESGA